jgi:hypothetical protein
VRYRTHPQPSSPANGTQGVNGTQGMDRSARAATDYLAIIIRVVRAKPQGQVPWWITAYQQTTRTGAGLARVMTSL